MDTLEEAGIRDTSLKLFESYLTNRQQVTRVNGVYSDLESISYGIPQGTVLGPILFNLYINGLFSIESSGEVLGFADDTSIFYKANSWLELKQKVEQDLPNLKNWFDSKLLTLNVDKTHYLPFSNNIITRPPFDKVTFTASGQTLTILPENKIKYLGVYMDSYLKWKENITFTCQKLRMIIYKFKNIRDYLQPHQLKILYHSLVESHLRYAIIVWGCTLQTHLQPLEVLQKRFLKIMLKRPYRYPSNSLFVEANVMNLKQFFYYNINIKFHTNKQLFNLPDHPYSTRKKHLHTVPRTQKSIGQRSYLYLGPKLYNTLPVDIKCNTLSLFKNNLKKFIKNEKMEVINNILLIN